MFNLCRSVLHLTQQGCWTSFSSIKIYGYRTVVKNALTKTNHTTKRLSSTKKSPDGIPRKDDFVLIYKNTRLLYLKWIPLTYKITYYLSAGVGIYHLWKHGNETIQISFENKLFTESCMIVVGGIFLYLLNILNRRTLHAIYKQRNSQLYVALRQHWYFWFKEIPFTKTDVIVLSKKHLLINKDKFHFFISDFIRPLDYNELFGFNMDGHEELLKDVNKKTDPKSNAMQKRTKRDRRKF